MINNPFKVVQVVLPFELRHTDCGMYDSWYHYATKSLEIHTSLLKYQTYFKNIPLLF